MSSPRLPLSARPSFLPDEISRREFATVFRGYDPSEVRTFLNQLAEQSAEVGDRVAEIQRTLADTEERVKNPELDEEMVTKLLGEQTAQILRSAREAANSVRGKADEEVSRSLREAHEVTSRMKEEAETLLSDRTEEAERMASTVRSEAGTDAERMLSDAKSESERMLSDAKSESEAMVGEAQVEAKNIRSQVAEEAARDRSSVEAELLHLRQQTQSDLVDERTRVRQQSRDLVDAARAEAQSLVDRTQERQAELVEGLVRKRKIALAQVEELRAGRQRLLKAYKMVRGTLDEVTAELERVEDEARQAAENAGVRSAQSNDLAQEDLDTIVEIERYTLEDDVSPAIIDLISVENSDGDSRNGEPDVGSDGGSDGGDESVTEGGDGGYGVHAESGFYDVESDTTPPSDNSFGSSETVVQQSSVGTIERKAEPAPQELWSTNSEMITEIDLRDDIEVDDEDDEDVVEIRSTSRGLIMGEAYMVAGGGQVGSEELDRALNSRREAVVGKARSQAVRRLKRVLQDEQDALVSRLRSNGVPSVEALLGSPEDQAASYQRSVVKLFREVGRTGAGSVEGSAAVDKSAIDHTGTNAARGMATELVDDLRDQLQPVLDAIRAADPMPDANELQHQIALPYRTIKGEYLDQMVDDRIGGVFDQGVAFARQGPF